MRDVQGVLVLRPDRGQGLLVLGAMVVATVAIVAAILIGDAPTVLVPIVGGLFTLLMALAIGALLRARIIVTAHQIIVQGLFGQQRRSRSQVAEVVRATITAPRGAPGESLFVLDTHRNLLIRVSGSGYRRDDLDRLVNTLGVPSSGPNGPIGAIQFAETYPGLVSRAERHPYRIAVAIAAAVCTVAIVVALVASATTS